MEKTNENINYNRIFNKFNNFTVFLYAYVPIKLLLFSETYTLDKRKYKKNIIADYSNHNSYNIIYI